MEIDKLNENNIKKYIKDTEHNYNLNVNKSYYGIEKDGKFIGGYDFSDDWISIFFRNDIDEDLLKETFTFLKDEISPDKPLVVETCKNEVIKIMNKLYKTQMAIVSKRINNIRGDFIMKEKEVDFKNLKIKYCDFDNDISCDLEGQNIKDKEVIAYLDKYFVSLKVKVINFIVAPECLDYVKNLGYEECIKKYIIN